MFCILETPDNLKDCQEFLSVHEENFLIFYVGFRTILLLNIAILPVFRTKVEIFEQKCIIKLKC